MRLDLYQAETERIAAEQTALLDEACEMLKDGRRLSALESNDVLHALQVLIENSIGKAKQWLKGKGEPVPVSAYDAFAALARVGLMASDDLPALVPEDRYRFVSDFLLKRI